MSAAGSPNDTLAKLLNQLNLPALVLILVMQGGNLWETKIGNDFNAEEFVRATKEIHQLYEKLSDYEKRQTLMLEMLRNLQHNQGKNEE